MKKCILAIFDKEMPTLPLPSNWELVKANDFSQGMKEIVEFAPSVLLMPGSDNATGGLDFLREVEKKVGVVPPSVIWGLKEHETIPDDDRISLGVVASFQGDPKFREILKVLEPFFAEPPLPQMTLCEFLSSVLTEERSGVYEFKVGATPFRVVSRDGLLQCAADEAFRKSYRDLLAQGGMELPEKHPDSVLEDISSIDAMPFVDQSKMKEIKLRALDVFFSSLPMDQNFKFVKVSPDTLRTGSVSVETCVLLRRLVDRLPLDSLSPLKKCSFKAAVNGEVKLNKLCLLPEEGYILHLLEVSLGYDELKVTLSLAEAQLLKRLYFLFALGMVETFPKGGIPQRISYLSQEIEGREKLIHSQSLAIEQFTQTLQIPGISPYRVLGISDSPTLSEALEAFKNLETLFRVEELDPNVQKKFSHHLTFIRGKIAEALLLLEASYLDGKHREKEQRGEDIKKVSRLGEAKTDLQKVGQNRQQEADRLFSQAKEFIENDMPYEAGQYLKTALVYNPLSSSCHHLLAVTYLKMGGARSKHMAEKEFKIAVENDPWNLRYQMDLARLYIEERMPNRAKSLLDQAQRIDPKSPEVRELKELIRKLDPKRS